MPPKAAISKATGSKRKHEDGENPSQKASSQTTGRPRGRPRRVPHAAGAEEQGTTTELEVQHTAGAIADEQQLEAHQGAEAGAEISEYADAVDADAAQGPNGFAAGEGATEEGVTNGQVVDGQPAQTASMHGIEFGVPGADVVGLVAGVPQADVAGMSVQQLVPHAAVNGAPTELQYITSDAFGRMERATLQGVKKADLEHRERSRAAGTLWTIQLTLELPDELKLSEVEGQKGELDVPSTGDVAYAKRLLMYQAHDALLPTMQILKTEAGEVMQELKEDGSFMPLAHYGVQHESTTVCAIVIPDEIPEHLAVSEALQSAPFKSSSSTGKGQGRKVRWSIEEIESLVEGVEKHGLSSWRNVVQDPRLGGKNNMQCKDKFRNLCLTVVQGRPERGLVLSDQLKERVKKLIQENNIAPS